MYELAFGLSGWLIFVFTLISRIYARKYNIMLQVKLSDKEDELSTYRMLSVPKEIKRYKAAIRLGDDELVQVARKALNCIYCDLGCAIILFISVLLHILRIV